MRCPGTYSTRIVLCVLLSLLMVRCGKIKYQFPFQDPDLPLEKRLDDLIERMTLEEKVSQMVNSAPAIERLEIPEYDWWNECLHGVARAGKATVFPQAIGLAATWNPDLLFTVSTAISDEARAKHHEFKRKGKRKIYQGLTFWSPNINIFRDPRWGRGMETYGEDPFLTGTLAVSFIKGLQGDHPRYLKLVATPKHFAVHSGPEQDRHRFNAVTELRDLQETYLPHFKKAVLEANAQSVMCAYNRYQGEACCGSSRLLNEILRDGWHFEGYVVSDCGAIHDIHTTHGLAETSAEAAALSVRSGCDLNCGKVYRDLTGAAEKGLISENEIDTAVRRLFRARMRLGMFDPPGRVPFSRIPYSIVDCKKHQDLALRTARESMVLLKNDGQLPLSRDLSSIAVIGPNAEDIDVLLGNYNGNPVRPVTPLQGIRQKAGRGTRIIFAPGCPHAENLPHFQVVPGSAFYTSEDRKISGLNAEYFDNKGLDGDPVHRRTDTNVDFNWWDGAPYEDLDDDDFGVRWTGVLVAPATGVYELGGYGFNEFRIYFEDSLLVRFRNTHHPRYVSSKVKMEEGKAYALKVEFSEWLNDASMQLLWSVPGDDMETQAINAAASADVTVMVLGLSPRLEGEEMPVKVKGFEGGDRLDLSLPDIQVQLLQKILSIGKPVVLVLLNGSALAFESAVSQVSAIVEAWYPGQAGGTALADVLFGDYNPAGRLPVTFYRSVDQLPPFDSYAMKERTYRYFTGNPLFPFGFGLSYTTFAYDKLNLPVSITSGDSLIISVEVQNNGSRSGEEVVQLYLTDTESSFPVPVRALKGFKRIFLKKGRKQTVSFTLRPEDMSVIDNEGSRIVEPGTFLVSVGGKQPGFSGIQDAGTTGVVEAQFEVKGTVFRVQ